MSATVDCQKFANYFNRCPVVSIPGRTFPVEARLYNGILAKRYCFDEFVEVMQCCGCRCFIWRISWRRRATIWSRTLSTVRSLWRRKRKSTSASHRKEERQFSTRLGQKTYSSPWFRFVFVLSCYVDDTNNTFC